MAKRQPVIDMDWKEFGAILLKTEDLDPVYVVLHEAVRHGLEQDTLRRILLAYWVYYNIYTAAYVAESRDFYLAMYKSDAGHAPRGFERRHMRGKLVLNTIKGLEAAGEPESVVGQMTFHNEFWGVFNTVKSYYGFGPWIAFKVTDMAERVLGLPIDLSTATLAIYREPRKGASVILYGDENHPVTDDELSSVVDSMIEEYKDCLAPPSYDRPVGMMEAETILCKAHAHYYGHYPLLNDIVHLHPTEKDVISDLGDWLSTFIPKTDERYVHG